MLVHHPDELDGEHPLRRDGGALGRDVVGQELALEQLQGVELETLLGANCIKANDLNWFGLWLIAKLI